MLVSLMCLIRDLYVSGVVQFILTVLSAMHLVVYWLTSTIFLKLCTMSGKFVTLYTNIGGGFGTLGGCGTSIAMDSLVVGSRTYCYVVVLFLDIPVVG